MLLAIQFLLCTSYHYLYAEKESDSLNTNTLILILSVSFTVSSLIILVIGILLGIMLSRCGLNCVIRRKNNVEPNEPVYEEVNIPMSDFHVEENIAYGPSQNVV